MPRGPRHREEEARVATFSRNHLEERLYDAGLKQPRCELCGQGELVVVRLDGEPGERYLLIESWHPGRGVTTRRRL